MDLNLGLKQTSYRLFHVVNFLLKREARRIKSTIDEIESGVEGLEVSRY